MILVAHHEWMSCCPCAMVALDQQAFRDRCQISACGSKINLDALLPLLAQPMHPQSHVICHSRLFVRCKRLVRPRLAAWTNSGQPGRRPPDGAGSHCATWALMRLADPWACFRVMTWLVPCSLLLALSACVGASPQAGHGLALFAQKTRPQRIAHHGRPAARAARAVPTVAATVTDADEKERLFQDFVEWQGAQDAAR